jgi:type II secretory ATPase GspE/PulE/Tfp pilus assembly ATPase PilB-like protein
MVIAPPETPPTPSHPLAGLNPVDPQYATDVVDRVLLHSRTAMASDVHFQATTDGLEVKLRVDGVLRPLALVPAKLAANVIARLKVQAGLLTYRTDMPQEGRIRLPDGDGELRLSTFPTLHGERAVVRLFGRGGHLERLDELQLPDDVLASLRALLCETAGAILISGPAGSGKTTTAYACLRELVAQLQGSRSLVSLEDPIEVAVPGVAQSQVHASAGLDLATGFRFLMRQDPEVILVGEIRDRATAEAALQASLTGHLLISTFHAGSAVETLGRLLDMGIEPYALRSGLLAIVHQRLLRKLCSCAITSYDANDLLGLPLEHCQAPVGCELCSHTGYRGRVLLAELLVLRATAGHEKAHAQLAKAVLARSDTTVLEPLAVHAGMIARWQRAVHLAQQGVTSPVEIRRVLGLASH